MEIIISSLKDAVSMLIPVLPVMFLGLFGIEILIRLGLMRRLEFIGRPIAVVSHLPKECVPAFVASIGSLVAANVMLARHHEEGVINDRELVLGAVLNTVPLHFKETLTYQLPVVLPLLGWRLCMIYIATFWLAGILKLGFVIITGRRTRKKRQENDMPNLISIDEQDRNPVGFVKAVTASFQSKYAMFVRMGTVLMIVTFLVQLTVHTGALNNMEGIVAPFTDRFGLPAATVAPLSAYIVSPIVGLSAMSTLMKKGLVTEFQTIAALLAGGFLMVPVVRLRGSLPRYVSILGWRHGLKAISITTLLSLLARLIVLVWVILFFD